MAQKTEKDYQQIFIKYRELQAQKIQEATLFIGLNSSGKTTLLQLFKKFIANQHEENLQLNKKGIYQYQNVINQKSLKIGTINPAIYQINKQSFVDVPVLIYQPEQKKWNSIDQAVTLSGVFRCFKKVRFVILVQQRFTQSKFNIWKKSLDIVIDYMNKNQLTQQIFNSISFIITRCSKIGQKEGINRLEKNLLQYVNKELKGQPQKANIYRKIIQNIILNKRLQVFKKTVLQEAQNQSNIKEIYGDLREYPFCQINSDLLTQKIKFDKGEDVGRNLLNQQCNNQLKQVLKFWGQSIGWLFKSKNYEKFNDFQQQKKKFYPKLDVNANKKILQHQESQFKISYLQSFKNKNNFTSIVNASLLLFDLLNFLEHQQNKAIKNFISILEKYGLIQDNQDETNIHKILLHFSIFEEIVGNLIEWDFLQYFKESFKECQDQNTKKIMRSYFLDDCYKLQQSQKYYQTIKEILKKFKEVAILEQNENQKYQNIQISCAMAVFDQKQYKKNLKSLFETFQNNKGKFQKDFSLLVQFYAKLGKLLMIADKNIMAAKILIKGGHLGFAIEAFEKSIANKQLNKEKDAMDYIQLLLQMFLKEEAKKTCFKLAHILTSSQNRNKLKVIITDKQYKSSKKFYLDIFFQPKNAEKLSEDEETQLKTFINNLQA